MKKNIFKAVIAVVFIFGAIVSYNVEAKAYIAPSGDCNTYCPNAGNNCTIYYSGTDTYVVCPDIMP